MLHWKQLGFRFLVLVLVLSFVGNVSVKAAQSGRSAAVGNDVFLEGQYLSIGISGSGSFGTASGAPSGFHPTPDYGGEIGLSVDQDGFDTGNAPTTGDFFLPGSPEERFNVGFKISGEPFVYSNAEQEGDVDIPRESSAILSSGDTLSARWTGIVSNESQQMMRVIQTVEFKADQKFFKNTIQLQNLSGTALDSVRYMRNVDPDQDADLQGEFTTINDVLAQQPADGKALVRAEGLITKTPIFYYSADARARVSTFGFSNSDPYDPAAYDQAGVYYDYDYIGTHGSVTEDQAISICADLGTLQPGATGTFVYYTSLDADFESALKKIEKDQSSVDTIPPVIRLPDYALDSLSAGTTVPVFTIKGSSCDLLTNVMDRSGICTVSITDNGRAMVTSSPQNGDQAYHLDLVEGTNVIEIIAVDKAGNRCSLKLALDADTAGPAVTIEPLPASVSTSSVTLTGSVSDYSGIRSLVINGETVALRANGGFTQDVALLQGANSIVLEATDNLGNVTHQEWTVVRASTPASSSSSMLVVLTIGQNSMQINGMPTAMDAAPLIKNGRTLLPIRALMEAIGGSASWNATAKTATVKLGDRIVVLTIGKNVALVGGKQVTIDASNTKVVPEIIKGRTYLPLRFIAENLGLDLAWDASSQTISFTYWP